MIMNWISITDSEPRTTGISTEYLVEMENGEHVVANWMNIGGWDFEPDSPIRYWMPIPSRTA